MLAHAILASARQTWPPFVLVAGLLMIGAVAAADGLFEATGARFAQSRLGARELLLALLGLVAVVTAVLNLDTAVVFLTPVLVHAARGRGADERPYLYGAVFMANAASLLLPGSNLTNLLVLAGEPQSGAAFAARMMPAWVAACVVTAAFVAFAFPLNDAARPDDAPPAFRFGVGATAILASAALVVTVRNPALPVLAVGLAAVAVRRVRPQVDVPVLALLLGVAVALGTVARFWSGPASMLASHGRFGAAAIGAAAAILVNNLPAAVLLSSQPATHPDALLLGLDLGPNLAVTGSLSAVLWLQAARAVGAEASIAAYSRLGIVLVPPTLVLALAALSLR
jgi:arsenical pump membrane protein